MARLDGKTCVITGGAGSLGRAAARLFLAEGGKVMLVDLKSADLQSAAADLNSKDVAQVEADVSNPAAVEACVDATVKRFGKIDVLFSNAGNFGVVMPIADYPVEVFDAVYAVHVRGAFLAAKYAVPHMNDGGSIVITSSIAGTRGDPGVYAYITAKHAQVGLMRCLAKELAPRRIRVNSIHPGPIDNGFQDAVESDLDQDHRPRRHRVLQRDHSAAPARHAGRNRQGGAVPGVGRIELHHRRDADGGWRDELLRGAVDIMSVV